jgi:hypothetical protein
LYFGCLNYGKPFFYVIEEISSGEAEKPWIISECDHEQVWLMKETAMAYIQYCPKRHRDKSLKLVRIVTEYI